MTASADIAAAKMELRRKLRALRRELAAANPGAAEQAAARLPLDRLPAFAAFSGYHAMAPEIDAAPLMLRLGENGATPSLPVAASRHEPLHFRMFDPRQGLEPDAFGVPAPPMWADTVQPDIIIAPVLAFDRRGRRLGQGAGHYDRTIANLRALKPVFVIGLAYAGQEVEDLPAEDHDERLDAILTETDWIEVG